MNIGSAVNLPITVTAVVAWLSSLIYVAVRFRRGRRRFSIVDAIVMVLLMATVSAAAMPLVVAAVHRTKDTEVLANLDSLRTQISQYKLEHNGEPPILYQGTLPQLLQATNADGMPGLPGKDRPYGPYFHKGLPANPVTRRTTVTLTKVFPPTVASGNGGWLFHADTGQIAIDLPDLLSR